MTPARLILIAGPSGSGKTTLARGIDRFLKSEGKKSEMIALDNYYCDLRHLSREERNKCNFDEPEAWELKRIIADAKRLKSGFPVEIPQYDFATHLRTDETKRIQPEHSILMEGLFALCIPELNELADLRFYVELDDEIALHRRIERDTRERGRTKESIITQYRSTVQPANSKHIYPSAKHAHVTLNGTEALALQLKRIQDLLF